MWPAVLYFKVFLLNNVFTKKNVLVLFNFIVFWVNFLREKAFKLKNVRFLLERVPFFYIKHSFNPEEYTYEDGLENYYLYNYYVGRIYKAAWGKYPVCSYRSPHQTVGFAWWRTTFTWLRNLVSWRSLYCTDSCLVASWTKLFWCHDISITGFLSRFAEYLIEFFSWVLDIEL